MHHRAAQRLFLATALLALPTPLFAQFTTTWLAPVSGSWDTAANWSNGVPAGGTSRAVIDATGAPYTIAAWGISSQRVDVLSADANVTVAFNFYQTDINLAAGAMTFNGQSIDQSTVRGNVPIAIGSADVSLNDLTLATDLVGTGPATNDTDVFGRLTLDHATVHLSSSLRPIFTDNVQISGTGTLLVDGACSAYLYPSRYNTFPVNLTIDSGIQLKTAPNGGDFSLDSNLNTPRVVNYGTISAEQPNTSIRIGSSITTATNSLSLTNYGLLSASNGGSLTVALTPGASSGNISLSSGGSLTFSGADYTLDQPLTVPATTRLQLGGNWKVSAPLTIDGGTLIVSSNPSASSAIQYVNGAAVQLINTLSAPTLPLLNTTASTNISLAGRLDLAGSSFSFASVPGQWSFPAPPPQQPGGPTGGTAKATIQNGTLVSAPVGNDLLPGGGAVNLSAVTVNFPLSIDDGIVIAQSSTTFAQPVTLSGTGRLVLQSFSNPGGITATAGTLELPTLPASPGTISMSGTSTLQLDFSTTLSQVSSLPYGSPGTVAVGARGTLDLQSETVDLSTSPIQLALTGDAGTAVLSNGTITDPSHTHPLRVYVGTPGGKTYLNQLSNVSCSADVTIAPSATLKLFKSSLHDSHVTGGGTLDYGPASSPQAVTLDNVTLDVDLHVNSNSPLTVTNGLTANRAFTLDAGSAVDLTTATLILNYTAPSPVDTLRTYLLAGRLQSSSADAAHRLGYLDSGSSVTVRLTLTGDANLDGVLNADDYALIDKGFATGAATWWLGDFNYDGLVTTDDYLLIDAASAQQAGGLSPAFLAQREAHFGEAYVAQLLSSIPEPASSLACLLATIPLLSRRRK